MRFFFDMDGVITDFDSMHPDSVRFNHPSSELSESERAAKTQFWKDIEKNESFWRDMPMITGAEDMISAASQCGEVFILSKTPGTKHFESGQKYVDFVASEKRKWVLKNLRQYFDENHIIICDGDKAALIHPTQNDILVDDRAENINGWNKSGGRGILFTGSSIAKEIILQIGNHK